MDPLTVGVKAGAAVRPQPQWFANVLNPLPLSNFSRRRDQRQVADSRRGSEEVVGWVVRSAAIPWPESAKAGTQIRP